MSHRILVEVDTIVLERRSERKGLNHQVVLYTLLRGVFYVERPAKDSERCSCRENGAS